ncbi:MAG: S8 family serine peptidase [SAR324 cluster bacterium]|nr:S8 family serine peptidase [SAR324 cluster bacterium]
MANVIYKTFLKELRPVIWYGHPIYQRYAQIQSILKEKLGQDYANLLSEPIISRDAVDGKIEAVWMSSLIKPKSVLSLSANQQETVKNRLASMIDHIQSLGKTLQNDAEKDIQQIGELLSLSVEIPGPEYVFAGKNDQITLVCWGFISDTAKKTGFRLSALINNPQPLAETISTSYPQTPELPTIKKKINIKYIMVGMGILLFLMVLLFGYLLTRNNGQPVSGLVIPDNVEVTVDPGDPLKRNIVSGLLSIYLKREYPLEAFMEMLKKEDGNVEIVGYEDHPLLPNPIIQIKILESTRAAWTKLLEAKPEVESVQAEALMHSDFSPNDPGFSEKKKSWAFESIKAMDAWNITQGKESIVIAIIDSGFDLDHPELKGKIVSPWNAVTGKKQMVKTDQVMLHGTHVSGVAGGLVNNGEGVTGICLKCKIMPIQVSNADNQIITSAIIKGLIYAYEKGANVINLSLGVKIQQDTSVLSEKEKNQFLDLVIKMTQKEANTWQQIFREISAKNIIVVQAAGNDNTLTGLDPMKRSEFTIIVAATESQNNKASFSNYGEHVTVSAPGEQIFNAVPRGKYDFLDGTSFSSPIVAGAVGLMKSLNSSLNVKQVREILIQTGLEVKSENKRMGPLVQLDAVLKKVDREDSGNETCSDEVQRLKEEIERLKQSQGKNKRPESMKIPKEETKDFEFAEGKWASSNDLIDVETKKPISLIFDIKASGIGTISLNEKDGILCKGAIQLSKSGENLIIDQTEPAICVGTSRGYKPYQFKCVAQSDRTGMCKGQVKDNSMSEIDFELYRL